jgi:hypothetical protein
MVQIEDRAGLGGKIGITRKDPASMLPRSKGIATEPTPQRSSTDLCDEALRNHVLPDLLNGKAGQRKSEAVREFTGKRLNLDDETGGKAGFTPAARLRLQARHACERKSLAPLAHDLARCIQAGGDDVIGQSLIREKDDLGANHITIR